MTPSAVRGIGSRLIAAAIAVLAAGTTLSGVGMATAGASPAVAAWQGTEHFDLMTTLPNAARYTVIATGLFTAGGVDFSGRQTDHIVVPGGSFRIYHGTAIHVVSEHFSRQTCFGSFRATARFTVGGGKGSFKGIRGGGSATIRALFIAPRSHGSCSPNSTPAVNEQTITATARIRL